MKEKIHLDSLLYGLYAALIPFNMILNFTGSTINKKIGILTSLLMIFFCILLKKAYLNLNQQLPFIFLITYFFLTCFWSIDKSMSLGGMITLLSLYLLFLVGTVRSFNSKEIKTIKIFMVISSLIIPFLLTVNKSISYSRETLSSSSGTADQNGLAVNLSFCVIIVFSIFLNCKKIIGKLLSVIMLGIIIYGMIATGSRGAVLGLLIALMYYVLKTVPNAIKSKGFWISLIFLGIGIYILFKYLGNNLNSAVSDRFSIDSISQDKGSGRLEIWKNFISILGQNFIRLFFGYGYDSSKAIYNEYFGMSKAPHNVFLQILIESGIIGLILFIIVLISLCRTVIKAKCYEEVAMLFIVVISFFTLGFFNNKGAWNIFLLAVLSAKTAAANSDKSKSVSTEKVKT